MTLPRIDRRSTAAQRRQQRANYAALKLAVAASPSMQKLRAKKRGDDNRARARRRMQRVLSGAGSTPWTAKELAALKPDELDRLRTYSASRYAGLTAEQKARLRDNLYLALVTISDADYAVIFDFAAVAAIELSHFSALE